MAEMMSKLPHVGPVLDQVLELVQLRLAALVSVVCNVDEVGQRGDAGPPLVVDVNVSAWRGKKEEEKKKKKRRRKEAPIWTQHTGA